MGMVQRDTIYPGGTAPETKGMDVFVAEKMVWFTGALGKWGEAPAHAMAAEAERSIMRSPRAVPNP